LERIDLDSTALAWVRYLPKQRVLQVGLRTGRNYDYFEVPAAIYRKLLAAESKGRYYNRHIRNDFVFQEVRSQHAAIDN
jgi:lysyl-tRNA synthetase class 2